MDAWLDADDVHGTMPNIEGRIVAWQVFLMMHVSASVRGTGRPATGHNGLALGAVSVGEAWAAGAKEQAQRRASEPDALTQRPHHVQTVILVEQFCIVHKEYKRRWSRRRLQLPPRLAVCQETAAGNIEMSSPRMNPFGSNRRELNSSKIPGWHRPDCVRFCMTGSWQTRL